MPPTQWQFHLVWSKGRTQSELGHLELVPPCRVPSQCEVSATCWPRCGDPIAWFSVLLAPRSETGRRCSRGVSVGFPKAASDNQLNQAGLTPPRSRSQAGPSKIPFFC